MTAEEKRRARNLRYYHRNRERLIAKATEWRRQNPHFVKQQHQLWKLQNALGVSRAEAREMLT